MSHPRILITRLSAIGDCILTMPLASALRRQFPDALLTWVAEPGPAKLLRGHECLDELIVVKKGWLKSPSLVWKLRRRLRQLRPDIAIDPQGLTKSSIVAYMSGARRRIGFAKPLGRELSTWLNNELHQPKTLHLVDRQLELLESLGVTSPKVRFLVPRDVAALETVLTFLDAADWAKDFAVINTGAGWDSRLWPVERYGAVARHLGETHGVSSVVVWAGPRERAWAQETVDLSDGHAVLAPPTSLADVAELLRRARLYVGSDTGPMHLASAVGTPCAALFGTTRPEHSGPYGSQHVCVQKYYQAGTSRQRRKASNDAMAAIAVDAVCEACDKILSREPKDATTDRAA